LLSKPAVTSVAATSQPQGFTYEEPGTQELVRKVRGYSGSFVKDSALVQQVLAVEFVPLRGIYKEVKLDCPLGLPGIDAIQ
jgi:hypothetical protein